MDKVLTISIAAYNVEQYIEKTLNSLICDEEHIKKLEVIIINDGSKDSTAKIAQKYVELYPETFILVDKENGGYGSTINTSLSLATGKYYKLLDGDDWVDTIELQKLLDSLAVTEADMAITKYKVVSDIDNSESIVTRDYTYDGVIKDFGVVDAKDALAMHFIAYRTSLLKDHKITITEKGFYTDVEYILKPIPYVNTVVFIDACVYMYRVGREGQSVSITSWQKHIDQALIVTYRLIDFWNTIQNDNKVSTFKKQYIYNRILGTARYKYRVLLSFPPSQQKFSEIMQYDRIIRDSCKKIYSDCAKKLEIKLLRTRAYFIYWALSKQYRNRLFKKGELSV